MRWSCLLLTGLLLSLASCGRMDAKAGAAEGADKADKPEEVVPVEVIHASVGPISRTLATTCTVEATQRADVFLRATGIVQSLEVEEGATVRAGQPLAALLDREQALAEEKARLHADKMRADLARRERMLKDKLISQETCEEMRYQSQQADLEWRQARLALDNTHLVAPIAGTITARWLRIGELATVNQKAFTLVDLSVLECNAFIPEKQLTLLKKDQQARVLADAVPGRVFAADILRISPVIDETSGTCKVTLRIANTEGALRPGMFVKVQVVLDTRPQALLLPKKAVLYQDSAPGIYVVREVDAQGVGVVRWTAMETGYADPDRVEVVRGLAPEDAVVIVGQHGLKDGTRVRIHTDSK